MSLRTSSDGGRVRAGAGGANDELVIVHGTSDRPVASTNVRDEAGQEEGVSVGAAAEKRGLCVDRGNAGKGMPFFLRTSSATTTANC